MTNSGFTTKTPTEDLAAKIARGDVYAGEIIAEFANGHDAANFARSKGADYTVTPGINLVFAVRPWIDRVAQDELAALLRESIANRPIVMGDRVRTYDFDENKLCYCEGTVTRLVEREGCMRYEVLVERDVWDGIEAVCSSRINQHVYPPVNGTPRSLGGVCNGVERVS